MIALSSLELPTEMVIAGRKRPAIDKRAFEVYDPASREILTCVAISSAEDVNEAAEAASCALKGIWRKTSPADRSRILAATSQLLRRNADRFARVESLDSGKPLREAKADVETAARYFEYYSGVADKLQGNSIPLGRDFMSFSVLSRWE
jgi:aldehyde dehydrogenase (NAD+)